MGKCCLHAGSFIFDRIVIRVAGNQDRHKSSDEFDFGPDQTTLSVAMETRVLISCGNLLLLVLAVRIYTLVQLLC